MLSYYQFPNCIEALGGDSDEVGAGGEALEGEGRGDGVAFDSLRHYRPAVQVHNAYLCGATDAIQRQRGVAVSGVGVNRYAGILSHCVDADAERYCKHHGIRPFIQDSIIAHGTHGYDPIAALAGSVNEV